MVVERWMEEGCREVGKSLEKGWKEFGGRLKVG